MKTVIIGGGKGSRAIIELATGNFKSELTLDVQCVVDPDDKAPGIILARQKGIKIFDNMLEALALPGIELVIELTGENELLEELHHILPKGICLVDHTFAHVFWDLVKAREDQSRQLKEKIELEKKIERERHFLQSSFDTIPELIIVMNTETKIIKINEKAVRFAHTSTSKAVGEKLKNLLTQTELSGSIQETLSVLKDILETGRPHILFWNTTEPEEVFWEITLSPILDQNLEIEAIVGTWHRITERVRLHREIESAEVRFRGFIDSAHDWISIKDTEGRYIIVNPVCAQAFKRKPEDFVGRRPDELFDRELAEMILKHDHDVMAANQAQSYEEIFNIDGFDRHYSTVRFPLNDYRGQTIGVCTIARDITQERELNDQLAQAVKLAAIGKLAAGVAHEINNPLTGVLAYAEDILDELPADNPLHSDIKVIIRETMRCRDIVKNLLDFARQETPKLEEANANDIVKNTIELVKKLPQFRNITLKYSLADNIPDINCDRHQIQQVILNLMINAAEALKEMGKIEITTEYDFRHQRCIITVIDNGPGVPENLKTKVFEPFFSTKGTNGLGLAVSWGIIERHKGFIEIDTNKSGGAIFRLAIPIIENDKK
ncbi:MAG: PAS domain-containing protein [Candidatus Zixiibacteriota bacterium]